MEKPDVAQLVMDLLVILGAGFLAGAVCRRIGASLIVGYLVVGAIIGEGALALVSQEHSELQHLAEVGALLLLFSVGLEFSLSELLRIGRLFVVGGAVQMVATMLPTLVVCMLTGMNWQAAFLISAAVALSSTVLVFKALSEWGQAATSHGKRTLGILLFQDAALVPLMLVIPFLVQRAEAPSLLSAGVVLGKGALFLMCVPVLQWLMIRYAITWLAQLRSTELAVLFTLFVLGAACWASAASGLPAAMGALAAGLILSENRLTKQIDTLVLPYRETFSAIFFVTLGSLMQPAELFAEPHVILVGLAFVLAVKTAAGSLALFLTGLPWSSSLYMGLGLAHMGEFSFLLIEQAMSGEVVSAQDYNRVLLVSLGSLILTPPLLKYALRCVTSVEEGPLPATLAEDRQSREIHHAIVVGLGPVGRQVASLLETYGVEVSLIDLSPVNLYPFAQQGFPTTAGDARERAVLVRAGIERAQLVVITVPNDEVAIQIARTVRQLQPRAFVVVRCRYRGNVSQAERSGADHVVCEEQETAQRLVEYCDRFLRAPTQSGSSSYPRTEISSTNKGK